MIACISNTQLAAVMSGDEQGQFFLNLESKMDSTGGTNLLFYAATNEIKTRWITAFETALAGSGAAVPRDPVRAQGYMTKVKHGAKRQRQRWFVLTEGTFAYYGSESAYAKGKAPLGHTKVSSLKNFELVGTTGFSVGSKP